MVEVWAAVAGASVTVAGLGVSGLNRQSQQGRDSLVRLTTAVDNLSSRLQILHDDINLKQTAILTAHSLADGKSEPTQVLHLDTVFASHLFAIINAKRMHKMAKKENNEEVMEIQSYKLEQAHRLADEYKQKIMDKFQSTFST